MSVPKLKDVTAVVGFIGVIFGVVKWIAGDDADPTLILYGIGAVGWGLYVMIFVFTIAAALVGAAASKLGRPESSATGIGVVAGLVAVVAFLLTIPSVTYAFFGDYERDGPFDRMLYTITGLVAIAVPVYLYHRGSEADAAQHKTAR